MVLPYQSSDPSNSEGRPECPPTFCYSLEIDSSKFSLHILSDTPGGSQRLKYILLMIDMFDHLDAVLRALGRKKPPGMENLFFTMKLARQKLSKYDPEVTRTMGMILISAHIFNPVRKL
jgi:hypothetical protein